jgi:hypothetical protein
MKASRIGEIAKIKPARMNGKRFMQRVYGANRKPDTLLIRQKVAILSYKKRPRRNWRGLFSLFQSLVM